MLRMTVGLLASLPLPAFAQVCESARLDLPEPIAAAVRPYVVCGMIARPPSDVPIQVNGASANLQGPMGSNGVEACAPIRIKAAIEADRDLVQAIPDRHARNRYIEAALRDADRFIAISQTSDSLGIDQSKRSPVCAAPNSRTPDAPNR